jgi:hypothetical protein
MFRSGTITLTKGPHGTHYAGDSVFAVMSSELWRRDTLLVSAGN